MFGYQVYLQKKCLPDVAIPKSLFNSALVIFKLGLCLNNKLLVISILSVSGLLKHKLQTSLGSKKLLPALIFFNNAHLHFAKK